MPEYRCLTLKLSDLAFTEQGFTRSTKVEGQNFILQGFYRPALYNDYIWVREISGFLEIWKYDPSSRLPMKGGNHIVCYHMHYTQAYHGYCHWQLWDLVTGTGIMITDGFPLGLVWFQDTCKVSWSLSVHWKLQETIPGCALEIIVIEWPRQIDQVEAPQGC